MKSKAVASHHLSLDITTSRFSRQLRHMVVSLVLRGSYRSTKTNTGKGVTAYTKLQQSQENVL